MKAFFATVFAAVMVAGLFPTDAEARRFGGARSLGTQRQAVTPQRPAAGQQQAQTTQQGVPKSGPGRWLAPLAGLAAGLGLAYLFGDQLGALVLALLIAFAMVLLFRLFAGGMQRRTGVQDPTMQYAGLGRETVAAPPPSQLPSVAAVPGIGPSATRIPAGFDSEGFLRQARKSFLALQAANDRGDLDSIRDLVTEEMLTALESDVTAHGASGDHTDVVTLNAELLEVVTENAMHWASIRFSGMLREERDGAPTPFDEVWNLQKPEKGQSGWLLAGIQQVT